MSKNVNRPQASTFDALSAPQAAAVGHLLAGKSGRETAAAVGVSEETVSRWRNGSPSFAAALNVGRHELHNEQQDALRQLRRRALDAVAELLDSEDAPTKLRAVALVLRLDMGAPGPQTPEQVQSEWQAERGITESDRLMALVARGTDGTLILPYAPQAE